MPLRCCLVEIGRSDNLGEQDVAGISIEGRHYENSSADVRQPKPCAMTCFVSSRRPQHLESAPPCCSKSQNGSSQTAAWHRRTQLRRRLPAVLMTLWAQLPYPRRWSVVVM